MRDIATDAETLQLAALYDEEADLGLIGGRCGIERRIDKIRQKLFNYDNLPGRPSRNLPRYLRYFERHLARRIHQSGYLTGRRLGKRTLVLLGSEILNRPATAHRPPERAR